MHYLDHAATTPMLPEAVDAVAAALRETGNPSSLHAAGRGARRVVEESRERLAAAVGAKPYEVVFPGGGPEADNLRYAYAIARDASQDAARTAPVERRRDLGLAAIAAERGRLERMRRDHAVGADAYGILQEELDWRELALLPDDDRRIEEG